MATLEQIKKLRDQTGAGVNAIKEALDKANGDEQAAMKFLREKGIAKADKRKDRVAANGTLGVYIHNNNRIVVVVEVNCETDFAAKSDDMKKFANDIAVHIAASNPKYISVEAIDQDFLNAEKETYKKDLEGKPEEVQQKILDGKLQKFYEDAVLTHQKFFLDDSKTVGDYLNELVAKVGEKIQITMFSRFEVAQDVLQCKLNK
jgi:elongation factor Ts